MVVVQFLAADEDAPRHDVGACVGHVVAAVTEVVANAVNDAGSPERNPGDLREPDEQASTTPKTTRFSARSTNTPQTECRV